MRLPILSTLLLSACTSLVPSTVMRLNNVSPLTADPAGFAVNLTLPDGIDVTPDTAQLIFGVTRSDIDQKQSGTFTLEREGTIFRIPPADVPALRALQKTAQDWGDQNEDATSGSLGINLTPCKRGAGPGANAQVSVALRLQEGGAFLPLVRNGPLSAVATVDQIRDMGACP